MMMVVQSFSIALVDISLYRCNIRSQYMLQKTWAQPIVVVQVALKGKQLQSKYKNRRSSWFVTTRPLSLKISLIFQSLGRNDKNDYLLPTEFIDSLKGRIQRWQPFPPPLSSPHPCPPPPPHHRHLRHLLFLQPQEHGTPLGP